MPENNEPWSSVLDLVDEWLLKCAAPAINIRQEASQLLMLGDVGYYWSPQLEKAALFCRLSPTQQDIALAKSAAARAVGEDHVQDCLTFDDVASGQWVKVAQSPALRRAGEVLNFFPGKYPGGLPNAPSPLAATLTGGLVGAGLGYGAGYLAENVLPAGWTNKRLRNSLATLGGAVGSIPGAAWAYSANQRGKSVLDGSDFAGSNSDARHIELPAQLKAALDGFELGERYKTAVKIASETAYDTFGTPPQDPDTGNPLAVNINQLGQTLWECEAPSQTMGSTMGAMYAAQQMPDPNAQPGFVTPHQTGLLGTMLGAAGGGMQGYATGWLVGKGLGLLTGLPDAQQNTLRQSGLALGIISSLVPKLFH